MIYRIREVLNYGGFFAGDTVTVTAHTVAQPDAELTLTIDQGALTNLDDRFQIVAGMALDVQLEGGHVVSAALVAAPERAVLRSAVKSAGAKAPALAAHSVSPGAGKVPAPLGAGAAPTPPDGPRIFSHFCAKCNLWILGAPRDGKCGVEGHAL
jgi:hypothetical protein